MLPQVSSDVVCHTIWDGVNYFLTSYSHFKPTFHCTRLFHEKKRIEWRVGSLINEAFIFQGIYSSNHYAGRAVILGDPLVSFWCHCSFQCAGPLLALSRHAIKPSLFSLYNDDILKESEDTRSRLEWILFHFLLLGCPLVFFKLRQWQPCPVKGQFGPQILVQAKGLPSKSAAFSSSFFRKSFKTKEPYMTLNVTASINSSTSFVHVREQQHELEEEKRTAFEYIHMHSRRNNSQDQEGTSPRFLGSMIWRRKRGRREGTTWWSPRK